MKAPLSYVPALPAAIGIVAGIIFYHLGLTWVPAVIGLGAFIILYVCHYHFFAFISLMVAIGIGVSAVHQNKNDGAPFDNNAHTYQAKIEQAQEGAKMVYYTVKVNSVDSITIKPFRCRLNVPSVQEILEVGTTIDFKGKVTPMTSIIDLPYEMDVSRYLKAEGIRFMSITTPNLITMSAPPDRFDSLVNDIRDVIYKDIVLSPVDGNTASFLIASILGDRSLLDSDMRDEFRMVGIAHILALSGLHVGIIAWMLSMLLFPLKALAKGRTIRSALTLILIWVYAILVGFTPSILRAAIMISVFILARWMQRGHSIYNSLFISIVIILCVNPQWLFTPGFQLSVAAVASILMFVGIIPMSLQRRPIFYFFLNLLVVSVSAMLGTGIVSAYYFNIFPNAFLLANLVTGVFFPVVLCIGIILAVFTGLGIQFTVLGGILNVIFHTMQWCISSLSSMSWASTEGVFFSAWIILPYAAALILAALALHYRKKCLWICSAALLILVMVVHNITVENIPQAELYLPRTLKSTCIFIRSADKSMIHIVSGDRETVLDGALSRYRGYLKSRGCDTILEASMGICLQPFLLHNDYIVAGDKIIATIRNNKIQGVSSLHVDYALVGKGYTGSISSLKSIIGADTILLGVDVNASRRKRFLRECGDSIPVIDLRNRQFCLKW